MRLLIADSEGSSLPALDDMLSWEAFDIGERIWAKDVKGAKERLLRDDVDILLAETEIAGESGFDLIGWALEKRPDIPCVILSPHPNGPDAYRAISLGARGFLRKPLDREEAARTLERVAGERRRALAMQERLKAYEAGERRVARDFWKDLFYDNIPSDRKAVGRQLENLGLTISPDWTFGTVLLMVRTWQKDKYDRLDRFVIDNVAQEMFERTVAEKVSWHDVMPFGERAQIAICGAEDEGGLFELCRQFAASYTRQIQKYADIRLIAYVGKPRHVEYVAEEIERLLLMDSQHLEDHGVVLYTEAENLLRLDLDTDGRFARYASLLRNGQFEKARRQIFDYLDELDVGGGLNKRQFLYFHTQYQEVLAKYAQENEIRLSCLVEKPEHARHFENALRNIQSMKQWIDCSLGQLEKIACDNDLIKDPVDATVKYIRDHLSDPLEMAEIAENVHFNQDYLTRIFKRRMDVSVKSYIVARRMESARSILEGTNLPIAEVACQVGYDNYTSFNRAFKKQYGESPQAFRQRMAG